MTTARRVSAVLLLLSLFTVIQQAPAQVSVYGEAMYARFGFTGGDYTGVAFKGSSGGVTGGVIYTFPSASRFKAGVDGRVSLSPGYHGGQAYTGALRASFVPNRNRFSPFFQIGGGIASTQLNEGICGITCGTRTTRITNGVLQLDFGVDIRLTPRVDIRADYGADAGTSNGSTKTGVGFLNTGVVYHFTPKATRP